MNFFDGDVTIKTRPLTESIAMNSSTTLSQKNDIPSTPNQRFSNSSDSTKDITRSGTSPSVVNKQKTPNPDPVYLSYKAEKYLPNQGLSEFPSISQVQMVTENPIVFVKLRKTYASEKDVVKDLNKTIQNLNEITNEIKTNKMDLSLMPFDDSDEYDWIDNLAINFQKNEVQKQTDVLFNIGEMYEKGTNVKRNLISAFRCYEIAATNKHMRAQHKIGEMYYSGKGVTKNLHQAAKWYGNAATQGYARAQYNSGLMYKRGEGVAKNLSKAVYWYGLAAMQGYARAQYNLGLVYQRGEGVAKNLSKAVSLYELAAKQGYARAQYYLGLMFKRGVGVDKDLRTAADWIEKAAKQGYVRAQNYMGLMHQRGEGVAKDPAKSTQWFQMAAKSDSSKTQ